jgi:hypothetical protein
VLEGVTDTDVIVAEDSPEPPDPDPPPQPEHSRKDRDASMIKQRDFKRLIIAINGEDGILR